MIYMEHEHTALTSIVCKWHPVPPPLESCLTGAEPYQSSDRLRKEGLSFWVSQEFSRISLMRKVDNQPLRTCAAERKLIDIPDRIIG
jgi:hypothetical protein